MTTDLRDLLASAADDQPPHDIAGRAMAGARRRRQGRLAVLGSVAAVTALVAGAVALGPARTSDEPRPQDVASLSGELPGPSGLPELTYGSMQSAFAAYVIDDTLVLVGADGGDAFAWGGIDKPDLDVAGLEAGSLRPYQVRLNPNGRQALVALRFESSQRLLGIRMAVLEVEEGTATLLPDLQLTDAYAESAWLEYSLMTWAPDSVRAYCVCHQDDSLGVWVVEPAAVEGGYGARRISDLVPAQISAGAGGVAVQLEPMGGPWSLLAGDTDGVATSPRADALALSLDDPAAFALTREGRYGTGFQSPMEKGMMWGPLPAGPVSSLQAHGTDYVLVSWPKDAQPGEPLPPAPLLAHRLAEGRDPQLLTTFPAGTTSTSFAADVDTVP